MLYVFSDRQSWRPRSATTVSQQLSANKFDAINLEKWSIGVVRINRNKDNNGEGASILHIKEISPIMLEENVCVVGMYQQKGSIFGDGFFSTTN